MHRLTSAAFAVLALATVLAAQGIDPVGRIHPKAQALASVRTLAVPALDRTAISIADGHRRANGQPARFAIPNAVSASPATHGTWEQLDATWSLWRLRVQSPGASHVNLGCSRFFLPANGRMMVYSSDYQDVVRPFDATDHTPTGELWFPVVAGEEITAEIYVPTASRAQVQFDLVHIGSGYRFFGAGPDAVPSGIDGSGTCNVDVVCPQGAAWAAEIPAIGAMSIAGSIFCTGSLINNTALDGKNYFLTANHCLSIQADATSLVVYWNYRNTTCGGTGAGLTQFSSGSTLRATWATSDFTLLELNSTPNPAWGVTRAGWNRGTGNAPSTSAVAIHHPSGDAKKISFEDQATSVTSYGGTAVPGNSSHVRITDWDTGTTEPGSSGSPLFDQNHRIIGQLHGGGAACGNNSSDWYGRFALSWTGGATNATRLSNWLDPINSGVTTLDTLGGGTVAAATPYGTGCYTSYGAYAQTFGAASPFDLGGTASTTVTVNHAPIANGYTVQSGPNAWFTPVAANLGLTDDSLSAAITLPFTFNFPGGSTTQIRICSNGYVWLNGTSTLADYQPSVTTLAAGPARLAPLWMDLNPAAGGTVHYDVEAGNAAVYVTWNGVYQYNTTVANTWQLVLRNTGAVEFRYRTIGSTTATSLVGRSRGVSSVPPNTDISAAMPFPITVDASGLAFTAVNRPILGTTQTINLTNAPSPATSIGLVVIGFTQVNPGNDLAIIGAAGCLLYTPATITQTLFPVTATTPWNLAIPSTPSLANTHLFVQGAVLMPAGSVNPFGLLTSNGIDLLLGTL
ncbi:MAG: trypsin-like peptidase domain-containing protein [Planctomycetes bacterium]|nr:trypsin-like peptidase domain-containing protein [Planctomycetota bacterium]